MSFDTYYPSTPFDTIDTNQRHFYDPELRDAYRQNAIYGRFVQTVFSLAGVGASSMTITNLINPHANFDPLTLRQMWMPASYLDSYARQITFSRYGGKLALHKHDDLITYWRQNGRMGLLPIINKYIGVMMADVFDALARNAFFGGALGGGFAMFGTGSGTGFADISNGETFNTELIDTLHLGMSERGVPYASQTNGEVGNIVCVTSPGALFDLKREARTAGQEDAYVDFAKYANPHMLQSGVYPGEDGSYHSVRFLRTPKAILYNCGAIVRQANVTVAIVAGEGSPASASLVDGVFDVGQQTRAGIKHYIQLSDVTDLAVHDIITIHVDRTNSFGITNGVDFRDGKLINRRIVSIDVGNNRISLDRPVMEDFDVEISSGVYGYVTKGKHIHTALFIGGGDGVVAGVGQSPEVHTPRPVDDFDSIYRVSWDATMKYQPFEPSVYEVLFMGGSNRVKGARVSG